MNKIPKLIHQTWKSKDLPFPFDILTETWKTLHPDWEFILWTDEMNRAFIEENHPEFLSKYDLYPRNIQRVDAFRYFVLNKMGGIYIDMDFECLKNIEELIQNQTCVIGKEPQLHADRFKKKMILCNAFMACSAENDFMRFVCDSVLNYKETGSKKPIDILNSTGPFMLTNSYLEYSHKNDIKILDSGQLYPITGFETKHILNDSISPEMQARIDNAYAVHYFLGNWS